MLCGDLTGFYDFVKIIPFLKKYSQTQIDVISPLIGVAFERN